MPLDQKEIDYWLKKHAAASAHMLELYERWRGVSILDPETQAKRHQEGQALVEEFAQFKDMPDEVWDILLPEPNDPEPPKPTRRKKRPARPKG